MKLIKINKLKQTLIQCNKYININFILKKIKFLIKFVYIFIYQTVRIFQMSSQCYDQEIESDDNEGFIPSKIIIKEKKNHHEKKETIIPQSSNEFVPRYITEGIMRKQPPQCYRRFSKFDFITEQIANQETIQNDQFNLFQDNQDLIRLNDEKDDKFRQTKNMREVLATPYDKYIKSADYMLVYSRSKDFKFEKDEVNFANNQVRLDCLKPTEQIKFKQVKPFQIIDERKQSVLTLGLKKNTSIREVILQFDSKFQSGNLLCAFKHKNQPYTYSLFIQNDTNSYGYNQWFYFSVRKAQIKTTYKFNIVNFRKRHSFFRQGNAPVIFSVIDSKKPGMSGYCKRGENIRYSRSPIVKSYDSKQKFYQLSFNMEFINQDDCCYISMGLPYSYSKLIYNLKIYQQIAKQNNIKFQLQNIGSSIAGNKIPYLTICQEQDDFSKSEGGSPYPNNSEQFSFYPKQDFVQTIHLKTQQQPYKENKKIILLMARQHPGQTWSSYLMDEFINDLVSTKSQQSSYLLKNYIFKIFPMINVDGVIAGNFRCDLTGMDLNRNWKNPSSLLHPQIFSIKNLILSFVTEGYKIESCFDFHGHSKQYNVFCYSCKVQNEEFRMLPYIFSQLNTEFYFPYCTFGISKYKQSTARAVIFGIIKNFNVLTIQASFFGSKINGKIEIFEPCNFQRMAQTLIKGCKNYLSQDQRFQEFKQAFKARLPEINSQKQPIKDELSGSDSEPSVDEIDLVEKLQKIVQKNLIAGYLSQNRKKSQKKKILKRRSVQATEDRFSKSRQQNQTSLNKNSTIDVISQSLTKQIKPNWETIKIKKRFTMQVRKPSHFKKNSMILNNQLVNDSQATEDLSKLLLHKDNSDLAKQKISFFAREKPPFVPIRFKNQSFQFFKQTINSTEKFIKVNNQTILDERVNLNPKESRKIVIFKEAKEKQVEQFPILCVLSETKKKTHAQKIRQKRKNDNSKLSNKDEKNSEKIKTPIQSRAQAIKRLRQKDKKSFQLVSKIWRQNFTRYGMAFSTFKTNK